MREEGSADMENAVSEPSVGEERSPAGSENSLEGGPEPSTSDLQSPEGTTSPEGTGSLKWTGLSEGAMPPEGTTSQVRTKPPMSDFWLVLALFVAFRLLTLFLLRPGGFIRDWSDFDTYLGIAAISDYGLYPFWHYWLEWPPL